MKKFTSILLASFLTIMFLNAQDPMFTKDDKVVNIGTGFRSALYTGTHFTSTVPSVSLSFEKGIVDNILEKGVIGIGGYAGYTAYKYEVSGWGCKYKNIIIGPRGSFHYPIVDKLDTYIGLLIGYIISSEKEFGTVIGILPSSGGPVWSGYIGGRYYFSDKIAGMLELGSGISYLNLGLAIKL